MVVNGLEVVVWLDGSKDIMGLVKSVGAGRVSEGVVQDRRTMARRRFGEYIRLDLRRCTCPAIELLDSQAERMAIKIF